MSPAVPTASIPQHHHPHHHSHRGHRVAEHMTTLTSKKGKAVNKSSRTAPPPLLGPLEGMFQLLQEVFHSRSKSLALSKGIVRALFTIYQNLKMIRIHAIVQCQFANDLKIRLVDLKRQLEAARNTQCLPSTSVTHVDADATTKTTATLTPTPEPPLKKLLPVLEQTEKIVSTLQTFFSTKPRLRRVVPPVLLHQLQTLPDALRQFPDHLCRQLSECRSLLQRIVVLYNQLAEAHRTLSGPSLTSDPQKGKTAKSTSSRRLYHRLYMHNKNKESSRIMIWEQR